LREPPAELLGLAELLKSAVSTEARYLKWLSVPQGSELRVLATAEILYLRADNKYTTVNTRSSTFLLNCSLKDMLAKLDPAVFWQIHRSIIVNVGAIDTIYRSFRGSLEVKLKGRDELLPVSAAHAHLFKQP
jgi:DNA-binding LytR/AlgR family response regulator